MKKDSVPLLINKSMASSSKSIGIELNQEICWSIEAIWTDTPVGTLTIEVSNDIVPLAPSNSNPIGPDPAANVVNWVTYTGSEVTTDGTDGNWLWNSQIASYKWVRLSYDRMSGDGTLNVSFFAKG